MEWGGGGYKFSLVAYTPVYKKGIKKLSISQWRLLLFLSLVTSGGLFSNKINEAIQSNALQHTAIILDQNKWYIKSL